MQYESTWSTYLQKHNVTLIYALYLRLDECEATVDEYRVAEASTLAQLKVQTKENEKLKALLAEQQKECLHLRQSIATTDGKC